MTSQKLLEINKKLFNIVKESAIVPYINERKPILTPDVPITIQPAIPNNPSSKYNEDYKQNIEVKNDKEGILDQIKNKKKKKDIIDEATNSGFIIEDMAVIPTSDNDLMQLAKVGLTTNTPAQYIVRDANTGEFRGGLCVDTDPVSTGKVIKAVDVNPEAGSMKKVIIRIVSKPGNPFGIDSETPVDIQPPQDITPEPTPAVTIDPLTELTEKLKLVSKE